MFGIGIVELIIFGALVILAVAAIAAVVYSMGKNRRN